MNQLEQLRSWLGDRYLIERELGRGGMGAVYLARDRRLDRPVALKVLPPEYSTHTAMRERFLRETRLAAGFSHPNIVPVYAVEEADHLLAFAMAYVEGETLADRVRRAGPLSSREIARVMQDVGYALAFAGGRGIVHRDIKPDNIMIERATGRALVMDFGIARTIAAATSSDALTRVGEVVGTPEFMSPEQATGDQLDGRSDLYSLALTAHFALTGAVAMSADSIGKVLRRQLTETPPPVASVRPDVPRPLADAIDRCLRKDPAERFPSADALIDALDAAQLTQPETPVAIRLFAQELGAVSMIAVGAVVVGALMTQSALESNASELDVALPLLLLAVLVITRAMQTFSDARRLTIAGFTAGDVLAGLAAVVDERAVRRRELRSIDAARASRRRTIVGASAVFALSLVLIRAALSQRELIRPGHYAVTTLGVALIASGITLFGVSLLVLVRSPFRIPVGELCFRAVWLGPIGRAVVHVSGFRVRRAEDSVTSPAAGSRVGGGVVTPTSPSGVDHKRVGDLESRVKELERWRTSMSEKVEVS